jgi:hypothetical protein
MARHLAGSKRETSPGTPGDSELAALLSELDQLSDEEAQDVLASELRLADPGSLQ